MANRLPEPMPVPGSEDHVVGRRFIRVIEGELRWLRKHHDHPNRTLSFDHVVVAHLIAFFNPAMKSLRKIEDIFDLSVVRKRLGLPRVPKSTLSDAQQLFDPALVLPLIDSLRQRVARHPHDARLDALTQKLLAVDGTFFAVVSSIS